MPGILRILMAVAAAACLVLCTAPGLAWAAEPPEEENAPPAEEAAAPAAEAGDESADEAVPEETAGEEPADLGQIEVTAPELTGRLLPGPVAVESFPVELFRLGGAEDLTALERLPWVNNQDYFGGQAISLMGLNPKFTQILVDGQRVTGYIDQRLDAAQLPLAGVERIEVIKGPISSQFGSGAIAGVINLVTRRPGPEFTVRGETRAGSHGYNSQSLELGRDEEAGGYFFSLHRRQRNAYDLNLRTVETDGDAYLSSGFSGRLERKLSAEWTVSVQGSHLNESSHNVQSAFGGFPRRGEFDTRRTGITGTITHTPRPNLSYTANYHHSTYNHDVVNFFTTITPDQRSEDSFRESFSDVELAASYYTAQDLWQTGLLFSEDRLTSERIFDHRARLEAKSVYVDWERYFGDDRALSLGLRADDHSLTGLHLSPKLSYWQRLSPRADLRLGYGHGFRTPSIKELYFNYNSPFGYSVRGNPSLEPEKADALTAVFTYAPSARQLWELGAFYEWVEGTITATEILSSPLTYKEVNLGKTRSRGLTLNHARHLGAKWELSWDQALTDALDLDTGARLPQSPRFRSALSVRHTYRPDGWVELLCSASSPSYTSIENERLAPGYVTLDLNWSIPTRWGGLAVSVRNLTGRTNRLYGPKPGREFFAGLVCNF